MSAEFDTSATLMGGPQSQRFPAFPTLDFQDKFPPERSLQSYSNSLWEQHNNAGANLDAHLFASTAVLTAHNEPLAADWQEAEYSATIDSIRSRWNPQIHEVLEFVNNQPFINNVNKIEPKLETPCTSATKSISTGKETSRKRRACSTDDKLKDGSCVTTVKEGKRQRDGKSSSENSGSTSPKSSTKGNSKRPEPPKDVIHVRARRGQATDSHSLAERVRREKISERMKFLQDLVPGCNKVTGKATMLDEIINYVQSLQRQVEFLSMKLAAVNPRLELNFEALLGKEMRGSPMSSYSQQLHQAQQQVAALSGLHEARRICFDPFSDPQTASVWDGELQNIVHMMGLVEK